MAMDDYEADALGLIAVTLCLRPGFPAFTIEWTILQVLLVHQIGPLFSKGHQHRNADATDKLQIACQFLSLDIGCWSGP
ncbi:hypothetical protein E4U54_001254 [Claviceps lovelessii]|nr:hypothetical protein E4U54_001254 [Claviceps lovelessii]